MSLPATGSTDWLQPQLRWITVPSWVLSVGFHVLLWGSLLILSRLPGCQADFPGDSPENLREVGLSIRPASATVPVETPLQSEQPLPAVAVDSTIASAAPPAVPDRPPVELNLPALDQPAVIGAGGPPRMVAQIPDLLRPSSPAGGGAPRTGAGGAANTTSFLGIQDAGKRFVYVIDCSSSMADFGALRVAKTELLASLERLDEVQQFQVIFASMSQIRTLDPGRAGLFHGSESDRLKVRLQIAGIEPDGGTDHLRALLQALEVGPDVLFYLTDGLEPPMTAGQLEQVRQRNRGTRIHTIEFGRGPRPLDPLGNPPPNFLTKLATQNDGRSTYRDVSTFSGR
ncbi:MAG: vWA domain-containing protein [Planctomycetaceae bacterium]